jgi:TRAP-type C4-dicarboxylate transport system permease small subunit
MPDERPATPEGDDVTTPSSDDIEPGHLAPNEPTATELLPRAEPFRTAFHWLGLAEQAVGASLLLAILVLVLLQVFQRYLPGGGWAWTGEIARLSMVWLTFVLSGYLMAHDGHIAIKVIDYFFPPRLLGVVQLAGHALIAVTCIVLVYATLDFIAHDRGQVTAAAEIPLSLVYAVPAFGFASTALRALLAILVLDVRLITRPEEVRA